jgi:hypothetical protein
LIVCLGGITYFLFFRKDSTPTTTPTTPAAVVTTAPPVIPTTAPPPTTPPPTATPTPTATATATTPPAPATITVPDLSGMTATNAENALKQAGFTKAPTFKSGDPAVQFPGDSDNSFTVTAQNPAAGSQAPADSEIVLTMTQSGNGGKG